MDTSKETQHVPDPTQDENRSALKAGSHALGLTLSYVPDWTPQDAFRELYQNW